MFSQSDTSAIFSGRPIPKFRQKLSMFRKCIEQSKQYIPSFFFYFLVGADIFNSCFLLTDHTVMTCKD